MKFALENRDTKTSQCWSTAWRSEGVSFSLFAKWTQFKERQLQARALPVQAIAMQNDYHVHACVHVCYTECDNGMLQDWFPN